MTRPTPSRDLTFHPDDAWLESVTGATHPVETPCCARCRRGTPAHGPRPCGYPHGCPNRSCAHNKEASPRVR